MTVGETRFALLVRLAWELRGVPVSSYLAVPVNGEPVLFVPRRRGTRLVVLVAQRGRAWRVLWDDGQEADARRLDVAARQIAAAVAA